MAVQRQITLLQLVPLLLVVEEVDLMVQTQLDLPLRQQEELHRLLVLVLQVERQLADNYWV